VNGVAQPAYNWTGSLTAQQNTVVNIGSYNFPAGSTFQLKAWTVGASGSADCNNYNDTTRIFDLGTPLCGVYTIGGVNPNFTNFYDASVALNNAGVACPVVFKVRNGTYNEQIKIYDIPGASAINQVTFESENGDSSLVSLHYQVSNPTNDFTLSLLGTPYVNFKKMTVLRTNGGVSVSIQNRAHNILFENCRLGNFFTPNAGVDSVLTLRRNNLQGYYTDLRHTLGNTTSNVVVENNFLDNLYADYCQNISITGNRNTIDPNSFLNQILISNLD
jgi:hypothetical protein